MGQVPCAIDATTDDEIADELRRALHARNLDDVRVAGLAARFAAGKAWDDEGYATALEWMRSTVT